MLQYTDLLPNVNNVYLKKHTTHLKVENKKLDIMNPNQKWLATTYVYALENGLADYKARSFSSELTLFITGEIFDTDVSLIYREDWLDSHLSQEFERILSKHDGKTKEFWLEFVNYMLKFYRSSVSWHYERMIKLVQCRISKEEKEIFESIPISKPKQKFLFLLRTFDFHREDYSFERVKKSSTTTWAAHLSTSEYIYFMNVPGNTKTEKFLNLLYFWYGDGNK